MTSTIVNAINLKACEYLENDKILTLFSYEKGLMSARIKGVKKPKAKLKFASEPFCFGQYSLCESKNGGYIVCDCENTELFYNLRTEIEKFGAASVMCEYCTIFVQENQQDEELFSLLLKCLNALCYGNIKPDDILLYFLINSLKINGYKINFETCKICGKPLTQKVFADFLSGGFCCGCNATGFSALPLAVFKTFKFISNCDLDRLQSIKTTQNNTIYALNMLNAFIEDITGKKLKSIKAALIQSSSK